MTLRFILFALKHTRRFSDQSSVLKLLHIEKLLLIIIIGDGFDGPNVDHQCQNTAENMEMDGTINLL